MIFTRQFRRNILTKGWRIGANIYRYIKNSAFGYMD